MRQTHLNQSEILLAVENHSKLVKKSNQLDKAILLYCQKYLIHFFLFEVLLN